MKPFCKLFLIGLGAIHALCQAQALDYQLKPRELAQGVWVIEGAVDDFSRANGCNIINTGWIETALEIWLINTGPSRLYGEQQRLALKARSNDKPVRVLNLNLHPDYFFGNQAWSDAPTLALSGSIEGMQREGAAYADNLYALCGDWMKDTISSPARNPITPGRQAQGRIELLRLAGHTSDDLVVIDHASGVVFAGGLVFAQRIPTTPHANLELWLQSLAQLKQRLSGLAKVVLVPSHGPVFNDLRGIDQTVDYLRWLNQTLTNSAQRGMDISEVLALPLPEQFATWGAAKIEYARNVTHFYPQFEKRVLQSLKPPR